MLPVMIKTDRFQKIEVADAADLTRWLAAHHHQDEAVWLVTWLKRPGAPYLPREAVLDALIGWGWIDGIRRSHGSAGAEGLGEGRTMQLISPRRQQRWTETYRARAERLIREGRMAPAGFAAIAAAKAAGTWDADTDVDALVIPDDLATALEVGSAAARFAAFPPSHRRNVLRWIAKARTAPTRAKRIALVAALAQAGQRVPQL
jgi:uncharacterized protein YdeI (YjbR/CyaY-like superfamily)